LYIYIYLLGGDDKWLSVWDVINKKLIARTRTNMPIRCCDFDSNNNFIAVGFENGSFAIYGFLNTENKNEKNSKNEKNKNNLFLLYTKKDFLEIISDVKFSPNSKMLAVGSHDDHIDIYSCKLHPSNTQTNMSCEIKYLRRLKGNSFICVQIFV
jgi:microtubule-associated protein-like 6